MAYEDEERQQRFWEKTERASVALTVEEFDILIDLVRVRLAAELSDRRQDSYSQKGRLSCLVSLLCGGKREILERCPVKVKISRGSGPFQKEWDCRCELRKGHDPLVPHSAQLDGQRIIRNLLEVASGDKS